MSDIKLNNDGDLDLTGNALSLVLDYPAIAQHLRIRLRTFLGEWFLDTRVGMPYFEEFFIKNPNKLILDTRIRECVLGTPGIVGLGKIIYDLDPTTRELDISFTGTLQNGSDFNFTFSEFIIKETTI
jgi:hypothetical protein